MYFAWGLHRFVLKENVEPPSYSRRIEKSNHSDIQWAYNHGKNISNVFKSSLIKKIMSSPEVEFLVSNNSQLKTWAKQRCENMFGDYFVLMARFSAWLVHKFFKTVFEKIVVD